jgi:hypothetical protein
VANKKKGKPRRRRQAAEGVDVNEQRRQKLEARRAVKQQELEAKRRREQRERLVRRIVYLFLAVGLFWFLVLRNVGGDGPIDGHQVLTFSTEGANQHVNGTVDYTMNPPVSGQHDGNPPACGTYAVPFKNELQVHALEHGAVGILYSPDLDAQAIKQIEEIVRSFDDEVFSAPQDGMDTPIAVTAWGKMMKLDTVDEQAIRDFIARYRGGGDAPEIEKPCDSTQTGSVQPSGNSTPAPQDTGAPEPSPSS